MIYTFDLGGSSIKGIKFDDKKNKLKTYHLEYKERVPNGFRVDFSHALGLIKQLIVEENEKNILLGFSMAGVVDSVHKKVLTISSITNIDVDLDKFFSDVKEVKKIVIQNDGKSALLGEIHFSKVKKTDKNVFFLTVGSAIGGASWINGKLLNGSNWFAGEYSEMFVDLISKDNYEMSARYCGTLQACYRYAKMSNLDPKTVDGKFFVAKVEQKDPLASEIFENWTSSLAKLIININLVLDVDMVIIGGGISNYEPFIKTLNDKITILGEKTHLKTPPISASELNNDAGCYGALHNLLTIK